LPCYVVMASGREYEGLGLKPWLLPSELPKK